VQVLRHHLERSKHDEVEQKMSSFLSRVSSAPISWGICEVPGWGAMLPTRRVLQEMSDLGFASTELGAPGFLPQEPSQVKALLEEFNMTLSGGFTPIQPHDLSRREATLRHARETAQLLSASGAKFMISAAIMDDEWSIPQTLTTTEHRHMVETLALVDYICAEYGLVQVLHPHVQTLVETADDVNRILDACDVNWCLDTGHLAIGGVDPVQFAQDAIDRVGHVHLKDVRLDMVPAVLARDISLKNATQAGLFTPLGRGDVDIAGVIQTLEALNYQGMYVIEQDMAISGAMPPEGEGPGQEVQSSLAYLRNIVAPTLTERSVA
jgi:inosose dehydratase